MRLYKTTDGQWAGTQADAKKLGKFQQVEVPTDKAGLLDFLNANPVNTVNALHGSDIPAVVITSGNTTNTPLSYVKDDKGVTEIKNIYDDVIEASRAIDGAFASMKKIMDAVGHKPHDTSLLKGE
tara:strand:+ start:591 stop:965 length:375 start_codon:yes stop_codon:yes gene_type:complete